MCVGLVAVWGDKDYATGFQRLDASCNAGIPRACGALGNLYINGWGTTKDKDKARALWEKACDGGDGRGCDMMGTFLTAPDAPPEWHDDKAGLAFFKKACELGQESACRSAASQATGGWKAMPTKFRKKFYDQALSDITSGRATPVLDVITGEIGQPTGSYPDMVSVWYVWGAQLGSSASEDDIKKAGFVVRAPRGLTCGDYAPNMVEFWLSGHRCNPDSEDCPASPRPAPAPPATENDGTDATKPFLPPSDEGFVDTRGGQGWSDRCWVSIKSKHWGWAKAECDEAMKLNPASPQPRASLLYNEGLIAKSAGDIEEARRDFTASLALREHPAVRAALDGLPPK
jgi:hypothetical protein